MPKPVAVWNSARDVWETPQTEGFFCEHWDVFLGTFPTSGMTVNGAAYELPTWEPATDGSASSSLLPTATARDWRSGGTPESYQERAQTIAQPLSEIRNLLPTPTVSDTNGAGVHGDGGLDLRTTVSLLRTPCAAEAEGGPRNPNRPGATMRLSDQIREQLLPTPNASLVSKGGSQHPDKQKAGGHQVDLSDVAEHVLKPGAKPWDRIRHGESMPQPSDAGSESLDGQLRGQLNLLDAITDTD